MQLSAIKRFAAEKRTLSSGFLSCRHCDFRHCAEEFGKRLHSFGVLWPTAQDAAWLCWATFESAVITLNGKKIQESPIDWREDMPTRSDLPFSLPCLVTISGATRPILPSVAWWHINHQSLGGVWSPALLLLLRRGGSITTYSKLPFCHTFSPFMQFLFSDKHILRF